MNKKIETEFKNLGYVAQIQGEAAGERQFRQLLGIGPRESLSDWRVMVGGDLYVIAPDGERIRIYDPREAYWAVACGWQLQIEKEEEGVPALKTTEKILQESHDLEADE